MTGDLAQAERREWWLANGLGAYAAGTIAGSLTRRYHALLVTPLAPPFGRTLVLAKADATLHDSSQTWPLFTNRWAGGTISPAGHVFIESFTLAGSIPVWRYRLGAHCLEALIWMEHGAPTTYLAYRLIPEHSAGQGPLALRVRLLVNDRNHHSDTQLGRFDPQVTAAPSRLQVRADSFTLHLQVPGGTVHPQRHWVENFDLPIERERGLNDRDHHLCVAEAELALVPVRWVGLVASLSADASEDIEAALARRRARDGALLEQAAKHDPVFDGPPEWVAQLILAADAFVIARLLPGGPDGFSVVAGYPWFDEWGRDTMISLTGLTLATGRFDDAKRILESFGRFLDQGMLPNVVPDTSAQPSYNSVDAALWYIEAWRAYVETTGDQASLERTFHGLTGIIEWYRRGTRYGIAMDPADSLLRAGERGVQLTWMDAKIGDWVVTPRIGKPVEINALWYNALCIMDGFARMLGKPGEDYAAMAERASRGFQRFVRSGEDGSLADVIDGPDGDNLTVRPNQILAVSLPHSPLPAEAQASVVARCARDLLTSYGLRSLAPDHPDYIGTYEGGVRERDGSYHQGPAWAWLLGHFALAEYRVHGDAARAQERLSVVADHLLDAGLGTISEIFDGDSPHRPRGAPAQAWSVACVLEAWWRLERARRAAPP
ncbi:amylo-alpha-1,6-glucosidase [Microvirga yunnanensis]|uniref:amylo-alpha-1,6-glucosidase n=1 Tax=Microvirga yunnanensis TaxID=2953740 RepID=UPI0021C57821|nr:amylo-alpha-1,6-glucosidase [Microvirga sp. HBU65207]